MTAGKKPGEVELKRLAFAFFIARIDEFLAMPLEDIQALCRAAGLDEPSFIDAMQLLQSFGPANLKRLN